MAKITLKDGSVREVENGSTYQDFVKSLSNSLAKKVLVAKVDGKVTDLFAPINHDANVEFLTVAGHCVIRPRISWPRL